jgi:hypothetical protein
MIQRIYLLIALGAGISSCQNFSDGERKVISAAKQNLAEMLDYRKKQIDTRLNTMTEEVENSGNKPKFVVALRQANEVKNLSYQAVLGITLLEKDQAKADSVNKKIKILYEQAKAIDEKTKITLPDLSLEPTEINQITKKLQVLNLGNKLTRNLAAEIGGTDDIECWFGGPYIMVSEESKVVEEGSKYYADVYPATSIFASGYDFKFTFEDTTISHQGSRGTIKYKPKVQVFDSAGLSQKSWTGSFTFKYRGKDSTIATKGEYWVRKCEP